jgi:hypothetical protein
MKRLLLVLAMLSAGCGGGHKTLPPPTIPATLAARFAAQSDEIARELRAGDGCAARRKVQQLQREAVAAAESGRVPRSLRQPLIGTVNDLLMRVRCAPPPSEGEHGHGKGRGKGKEKHGKGDE